jgi:hypothetical protein
MLAICIWDLAIDLIPKRQRPYRVLNVGLTECFGIEWASESPPEVKARPDKLVALAGTGKYAGITSSWSGINHLNEFKVTAAETTYVHFVEFNGSYKLP